MGRFTGFICDRQGCETMGEGSGRDKNQPPIHWPRINITVDDEEAKMGEMVFCSDACSLAWFALRVEEVAGGNPSKILHNLNHGDNPRADCWLCEVATR